MVDWLWGKGCLRHIGNDIIRSRPPEQHGADLCHVWFPLKLRSELHTFRVREAGTWGIGNLIIDLISCLSGPRKATTERRVQASNLGRPFLKWSGPPLWATPKGPHIPGIGKTILLQVQGFRFGQFGGFGKTPSLNGSRLSKRKWLQHRARQEAHSPNSWHSERSSCWTSYGRVLLHFLIFGDYRKTKVRWGTAWQVLAVCVCLERGCLALLDGTAGEVGVRKRSQLSFWCFSLCLCTYGGCEGLKAHQRRTPCI